MRYQDLQRRVKELERQCEEADREAFHWAADSQRGRWKSAALGFAAGIGSGGLIAVVVAAVVL